MRRLLRNVLPCVLATLAIGCSSSEDHQVRLPDADPSTPAPWDPDQTYMPALSPQDLMPAISQPLFPAPAGATWTYELHGDEGLERTEVAVEPETREVWGATATVVRDTVYIDGEMAEDTRDWYAQDTDGNVWYVGEDTAEYEDGEVVSTAGAWEAGVDGGLPGIIMLADPQVGDVYREEYLAGEAEDLAEIVALDQSVTVPAGSFSGCVKTRNTSVLERDVEEFKFYCPGVGVVLELEDGERVELVDYSVPSDGNP